MRDNREGSWNAQALNYSHEKRKLVFILDAVNPSVTPPPIKAYQYRWSFFFLAKAKFISYNLQTELL